VPGRLTRAAALAGLAAIAAAGCGGRPAAKPAEPREEAPAPRRGGDFVLALGGIETLDPARASNLNECFVVQQVFDGLVELGEDLRIQPSLARTWSLSDDRRTFQFVLADARFQNGRKVVADDVVFSFERLLDPRIGSAGADFLSIVEGAAAFQSRRAEHVAGLRATAADTVSVTLVEPYQPFLGLLAMQYAKIVPREEVERTDFGRRPVGSGAFRFESWSDDGTLILAANDSGFHGRPYLDRVVVRDIDRETEVADFRRGAIDYFAASAPEFDALSKERRYVLTKRPSLTLTLLGFNVARPPFDDVRIRRAVEHAIDRPKLASVLDGRAVPAGTILPPGMPGYDPSAAMYPFDPAKCAELLAAAGHPEGRDLPELRLFVGRLPSGEIVVDELVRELEAAHVRVKVDATEDFGDYLGRIGSSDLFILGWGADFPDPDNFFEPLFRTGARYNFGHYSNPSLDDWIADARHRPEKVERLKTYRLIERRLLEDAVIAPLFHDASLHSMQPSIADLPIGPLGIYYAPVRLAWKKTGSPSQ
jgi:peptide/nickel transport system substrate-binding protein